eukprot:991956_1
MNLIRCDQWPMVTIAYLLIGLCLGDGEVTFPQWSWDSLQSMTFFQGCNGTGTEIAFNPTMLDVLSRYNVITIEKGQGQDSSVANWYAEDYMLAAAKQIKSVNPTAQIGYYLNSVLDWTQYRLHHTYQNHPQWWLRNATGAVIRSNGDMHFNNHTDLLNFDMSQDAVAALWKSSCLNMTDTPYFDSCTLDRVYQWSEGYKNNNTLSNKTDATFNAYKYDAIVSMQYHLNTTGGGPLYINNGFHIMGVNGLTMEGWKPIEEDILMLCNRSDDEQLSLHVHGGYGLATNCSGQSFIDVLAAYLIGVQKYQYFQCNQIWIGGTGNWHKEYEYDLGKPKAQPIKMNDTYFRSFASNTSVVFNTVNNSGTIYWSHQHSTSFLDHLEDLYTKEWHMYHKDWKSGN